MREIEFLSVRRINVLTCKADTNESVFRSEERRHAANDWALVRHHVRRNVHRAFVRLLANRAVRIKGRVDREGGEKWGRVRILAR